jgi:hypothetical protein
MLSEDARRFVRNFALMLLAGSLGFNVWLLSMVMSFVRQQHQQHHLVVGSQVPPVDLTDFAGRRVTLGFGPDIAPTLIYWFGPKCVWCIRNKATFESLAVALGEKCRLFRIAGSTEGLEEYLADSHDRAPIYTDPTGTVRALYGLDATPRTLVLSPEGRVLGSWTGAYEGETRYQIEQYFHVELAGPRGMPAQSTSCDTCSTVRGPLMSSEAFRQR